jgi:hypothetical protein
MLFAQKYKPNTQKSLFHKDIVSHIRKWIKMLEELSEFNKSVKQILFIYGPIGCAKSVTIECLFKAYNLIEIESDNIRLSDKTTDIIDLILNFNDLTLINIEKINHKNKKDKKNILLIDNIESCEKSLENFIQMIHVKYNKNIPIILISNNKRFGDFFTNYSNCNNIEFKKPSLLELTKLTNDINKQESLHLSKEDIKLLIDKSQFDIRQLLFILEQWTYGNSIQINSENKITFTGFIESIRLKDQDLDLYDKLMYLFENNNKYNLKKTLQISSSEPQIISNSIYQNYISIYTNNKNSELSPIDNLKVLENYSKIMDSISLSNTIHNEIYENQNWDLYNNYTFSSCIEPYYYLKSNLNILSKYINTNNLSNSLTQFKDVSYNFTKSYEEVKKICKLNQYDVFLNFKHAYNNSYLITNFESCVILVNIIIMSIKNLNEYFDNNKKGKNTTKKEKLFLCNNITKDPVKKSLEIIVNNIYYYKLFEIDLNQFIINKSKYINDKCTHDTCTNVKCINNKCINDDIIKENINQIDLRVFKRLLNIFTFDDSNKLFKSNIEISIQYKLLQLLVNDFNKETPCSKIIENNINHLTVNLEDIWNL